MHRSRMATLVPSPECLGPKVRCRENTYMALVAGNTPTQSLRIAYAIGRTLVSVRKFFHSAKSFSAVISRVRKHLRRGKNRAKNASG
jgi:hypothetical protein